MATGGSKGRPKLASGTVGRERLIKAAREMLRDRPRLEFNKKSLAATAGVSQALISYYFPDQPTLVNAVAKPVIASYLSQLAEILRDKTSHEAILRRLIRLLLAICYEDGYLVDSYIAFLRRGDRAEALAVVGGAYSELMAFFLKCQNTGLLRANSPAIIATLLWGNCKIIVQTPALSEALLQDSADRLDLTELQVETVYKVFLHGFGA